MTKVSNLRRRCIFRRATRQNMWLQKATQESELRFNKFHNRILKTLSSHQMASTSRLLTNYISLSRRLWCLNLSLILVRSRPLLKLLIKLSLQLRSTKITFLNRSSDHRCSWSFHGQSYSWEFATSKEKRASKNELIRWPRLLDHWVWHFLWQLATKIERLLGSNQQRHSAEPVSKT